MLAFSPSGKLVLVFGWEPEWTVLSGLPFFSVRHGLRVVASHGSADPTTGGAVLFHRMGQQCWLEEHRRQSYVIRIGDRWPDTLATHLIETVRPNKKRHRVRAPLDAAQLYTKCNGTGRRGKPWRLLRMPHPVIANCSDAGPRASTKPRGNDK
jgi:hypothetical protein